MIQKTRSLVDELYRVYGKAEIIDGRIVLMSPAGEFHGWAGLQIVTSLVLYERKHRTGIPYSDNVGCIVNLPNRQSFSPDVGWVAGRRRKQITPKFVDGPPTFAVEVRSPEDYGPVAEKQIQSKIADYFAAGTLVVWDVDLESDAVIRCYRASDPEKPTIFRRGQKADAEPAVPGWKFAVRRLFP